MTGKVDVLFYDSIKIYKTKIVDGKEKSVFWDSQIII